MPVLDTEPHRRRIAAPDAPKPSQSGGEKGPRALPLAAPAMTVQAALAAMEADGERRKKARDTGTLE